MWQVLNLPKGKRSKANGVIDGQTWRLLRPHVQTKKALGSVVVQLISCPYRVGSMDSETAQSSCKETLDYQTGHTGSPKGHEFKIQMPPAGLRRASRGDTPASPGDTPASGLRRDGVVVSSLSRRGTGRRVTAVQVTAAYFFPRMCFLIRLSQATACHGATRSPLPIMSPRSCLFRP